jgi:hypothetical protein
MRGLLISSIACNQTATFVNYKYQGSFSSFAEAFRSYPPTFQVAIMLLLISLIYLLPLAAVLDAAAIPAHHEVHEKRHSLHSRWKKRDRVQEHKLFPMRIGLAQSNIDNGYQHLMDV